MAPPSTPDKYPPADAYDYIIRIVVGKKKRKTFEAHRGVLAFYSGYFEAAFKGEFIEADKREVHLNDQDAEVVGSFIRWCYSRRVSPHQDEHGPLYALLVDLWIFGDAHIVPLLQNEMCSCIVDGFASRWNTLQYVVKRIYSATPAGSPLRRLVIDLHGKTASSSFFEPAYAQFWCKEALMDLARSLISSSSKKQPTRLSRDDVRRLDLCQYHVHEEGVKCPKRESEQG